MCKRRRIKSVARVTVNRTEVFCWSVLSYLITAENPSKRQRGSRQYAGKWLREA